MMISLKETPCLALLPTWLPVASQCFIFHLCLSGTGSLQRSPAAAQRHVTFSGKVCPSADPNKHGLFPHALFSVGKLQSCRGCYLQFGLSVPPHQKWTIYSESAPCFDLGGVFPPLCAAHCSRSAPRFVRQDCKGTAAPYRVENLL